MDMKRCKKCGEEKPLDDYYQNKYGVYQARCKPCFKAKGLANAKKGKYWKKQNNKQYAIDARETYNTKLDAGVYMLKNVITGDTYIGESTKPQHRIVNHYCGSSNIIDKSSKNDWIWGIIEYTPNHKEREQYWISKLNPTLNSHFNNEKK